MSSAVFPSIDDIHCSMVVIHFTPTLTAQHFNLMQCYPSQSICYPISVSLPPSMPSFKSRATRFYELICWSVGGSICVIIHLSTYHTSFTSVYGSFHHHCSYCITTLAHPHATRVAVYPVLILFSPDDFLLHAVSFYAPSTFLPQWFPLKIWVLPHFLVEFSPSPGYCFAISSKSISALIGRLNRCHILITLWRRRPLLYSPS